MIMKLSVSLVLVILASCCFEGNAVVCPDVVSESSAFLFATKEQFRQQLAKYGPPSAGSEAMVEAKKCTDTMSYSDRALIGKILAEIVNECNQ